MTAMLSHYSSSSHMGLVLVWTDFVMQVLVTWLYWWKRQGLSWGRSVCFLLAIFSLSLSECQAVTMLDMLTSHKTMPALLWTQRVKWRLSWTCCKRIHMHANLVMWSHYLSSSHMRLVNGVCLNRFPDVGIGEICEKSQAWVEEEEFVCWFW